MRLFVALDIPGRIRSHLREYTERARALAPEARWARTEGLHVTLKFIGEVDETKAQKIMAALASVKGRPFSVKFDGTGFFPSARSPRVFWIGVEGGSALAELAGVIDNATEKVGVAKEARAYSPHLTLARTGSTPGSQHQLKPLALRLETEAPAHFGTMTAREFFLYRSQPQRGGSKYTKLHRFALEED